MYISKIELINFRNYENQKIILNKGINILFGDNAQGKTNIIEAIFLCGLGKSFRCRSDKDLIKFDKNFSEVNLDYEKKDRKGSIKLKIGERKDFFINNVKQTKISNILGKINIVSFSPDDIKMIKEGPRKKAKIYRHDDKFSETKIYTFIE